MIDDFSLWILFFCELGYRISALLSLSTLVSRCLLHTYIYLQLAHSTRLCFFLSSKNVII